MQTVIQSKTNPTPQSLNPTAGNAFLCRKKNITRRIVNTKTVNSSIHQKLRTCGALNRFNQLLFIESSKIANIRAVYTVSKRIKL